MHSNVSESTSNHAAEDADISHTTESNGEEEHLQLSLVESFFLAFGLDCLQIVSSDEQTISLMNCWKLFCLNAVKGHNLNNVVAADYQLPYRTIDVPVGLIQFDNPFIINYVAYHYYRSKAWVIKDGLKFGVDYNLVAVLCQPAAPTDDLMYVASMLK
ncbi:tRNA splicing endonuclease subunit sen2 [Umbelopsis nana]